MDYLILEHIANNTAKEIIEDKEQKHFNVRTIYSAIDKLKQNEYISDNNKLTLKGKELLDQLQKEEVSTDFYSSLHKNLQEKMQPHYDAGKKKSKIWFKDLKKNPREHKKLAVAATLFTVALVKNWIPVLQDM